MSHEDIEGNRDLAKRLFELPLFYPKTVAEFSHIKLATLQNYMHRRLLSPSTISGGQGNVRLWSIHEMLSAALMGDLVSLGFQPSSVSVSIKNLAAKLLMNLYSQGFARSPSSAQVLHLPRIGDLDDYMAHSKRTDDSDTQAAVRNIVNSPFSLRVDIYSLEEQYFPTITNYLFEALHATAPDLYEEVKKVFGGTSA